MRIADMPPEFARALLDALPAGLLLLDGDDRIVWANHALGEIMQQPVAELTGQSAAALPLPLPKDDDPPAASGTHKVHERGRLVGISCALDCAEFSGRVMLVIDRGHASFALRNALPDGGLKGSVNVGPLAAAEAIRQRLEVEISRSRRYANPLSCLIVRIAAPGEHAGEEIGDAVFGEAARIVKEQLRWVDVLGHWGRDAIIVVLPETNAEAARTLADKLSQAMRSRWAATLPPVEVRCATSTWQKGDDVDRLVSRAIPASA